MRLTQLAMKIFFTQHPNNDDGDDDTLKHCHLTSDMKKQVDRYLVADKLNIIFT